jgi:hypothetical protein
VTLPRAVARSLAALLLLLASQQPALALPTMIRLGYSECSACHISPQGGGLLNAYGRGIDRAQSLRGGEYVPSTDNLWRELTFGGRTTQDLRTVTQDEGSGATGAGIQTDLWPRLMYRNVTQIGKGFRVTGTVTGENGSTLRPALSYDPPSVASSVFVNTALVNYHAGQTLEFAAGRDQLPSGLNIPVLTSWIKASNRLGYYDAPTQLKMFWTASRIHVTPFVYASGGNEAPGERETGAGTLAEVVLGPRRTVLGTSILHATALNGDRQTLGGYARLGFGSWGILAEHDFTERTRVAPEAVSFGQNASYVQLFWAAREWLVASAIGERLQVDRPFEENLVAGKLDLAARLASQATVDISTRVQQDQITGRATTSVVLQVALKTVP